MNPLHQRRRLPFLWLVARCCFATGAGILLYMLLNSGHSGIPGWQSADESLRVTLSIAEATAPSPARSMTGANGRQTDGPLAAHSIPSSDPLAVTQSNADSQAATSMPNPSNADSQSATSIPNSSNAPSGDSLLDLNAATAAELDSLPGIGPSKAQAILDFRDARQGFRSVEELLEVKGIGPKLYDRIRALVKTTEPG